jgi:hypothetical protein
MNAMTDKPQARHSADHPSPEQGAPARPQRRSMLKAGASSVALAGVASQAGAVLLPSPPTTPFLEAMPITPELPASAAPGAVGVNPSFAANRPTLTPNRAINPATGAPIVNPAANTLPVPGPSYGVPGAATSAPPPVSRRRQLIPAPIQQSQ